MWNYGWVGGAKYYVIVMSLILQSSKFTKDPGAIQKAADFVQAFMLGFSVEVCAVHSGRQMWEVTRDLCPIACLRSM